MKYDGLLTRQSLIDFCQEKANVWTAELGRESEILVRDKKTMSDDQYETLMLSTTSLAGHILALRMVCEWAKENKIEVTNLGEVAQFYGV